MYQIGDCIFYPMHGAGVVEAIEERNILGKRHNYYFLRIPVRDILEMLPVETADRLGVRFIKSAKDIDGLMSYIEAIQDTSCESWNRRHRENIEKIRSGELDKIAEVVKYLVLREHAKGLSSSEKKTLSHAKQILYSEIIMVKKLSYEDVDQMITERIFK